jgi:hypothetical protein
MAASFGKRGLIGAATTKAPPGRPAPPPRRMRSGVVTVGAVGALALGIAAAAEWRGQQCAPRQAAGYDSRQKMCDDMCRNSTSSVARPAFCEDLCRPRPTDPTPSRAVSCDNHGWSHGHSSGHSWGFFSGGGIGHASFGGFGAHGFGHGGG